MTLGATQSLQVKVHDVTRQAAPVWFTTAEPGPAAHRDLILPPLDSVVQSLTLAF